MDVTVSDWQKTAKELFPEASEVTPEKLLARDAVDDQRLKDAGNEFIKEVRYSEIDGVKGSFLSAEDSGDRISLTWHTHRYYKGKIQRISINITGERGDSDEMMKIVNSAKFGRN